MSQISQAYHLRTDLISTALVHLGFGASLSTGKVFDAFLAPPHTFWNSSLFSLLVFSGNTPFSSPTGFSSFPATFCVRKLMTGSPCPGLSASERCVTLRSLMCRAREPVTCHLKSLFLHNDVCVASCELHLGQAGGRVEAALAH